MDDQRKQELAAQYESERKQHTRDLFQQRQANPRFTVQSTKPQLTSGPRKAPPLIRAPVLGINPLPVPVPQLVTPRLAVPRMAGAPQHNPQLAQANLQQRMEDQAEHSTFKHNKVQLAVLMHSELDDSQKCKPMVNLLVMLPQLQGTRLPLRQRNCLSTKVWNQIWLRS